MLADKLIRIGKVILQYYTTSMKSIKLHEQILKIYNSIDTISEEHFRHANHNLKVNNHYPLETKKKNWR